jgi:hypothetical protein
LCGLQVVNNRLGQWSQGSRLSAPDPFDFLETDASSGNADVELFRDLFGRHKVALLRQVLGSEKRCRKLISLAFVPLEPRPDGFRSVAGSASVVRAGMFQNDVSDFVSQGKTGALSISVGILE